MTFVPNATQNKHTNEFEKATDTLKANIDKSAEQSTQFTDAAREGVNKIVDLNERAIENTKHVMQKGVETASHQAREATDRFTRTLGYTGEGSERLAQQSKQNMEAVVRCGTVLTQAFQDTSRIWLELSQKQWQRNLEGMINQFAASNLE